VAQCRDVAVEAEAGDDALGVGRHERAVPELLALVHVGEVDLDERGSELGARVADGDGVVGPGGGVEDHRVAVVGGLVEPLEHLALVVRLAEVHVEAQFRAGRDAERLEVGEGLGAVDRRFALAEPVEVRAVQDQGLHAVSLS
jgi:hypothetical protein